MRRLYVCMIRMRGVDMWLGDWMSEKTQFVNPDCMFLSRLGMRGIHG